MNYETMNYDKLVLSPGTSGGGVEEQACTAACATYIRALSQRVGFMCCDNCSRSGVVRSNM